MTSPSEYFEAEQEKLPAGIKPPAKLFAFYLAQFHAIPENDRFWGTGFTEWHNLTRGQPRFFGHQQPRVPRDFGFYNLLDIEVIRRQVRAALDAGLFGFCFYFYWFNGKRVLEKPLDLFVEDEQHNMPYCLLWANENWTRRWDGLENDVLLRQDYNPAQDNELFDCLAGYFASPKYYRIQGRPLFVIYRPGIIPDCRAFFSRLRGGVRARMGVEPLILMAQAFGDEDPTDFGLDGALEFPPHKVTSQAKDVAAAQKWLDWDYSGQVFDYDEIAAISLRDTPDRFPLVKTIVPSWDNDARKQGTGLCIHGSAPAKFASWLQDTIKLARQYPVHGEKLVFVNAWNEWCEGAYLEPDMHHGWAYLNSIARVLGQSHRPEQRWKVLLIGHDAFPAGAQKLLLNVGKQLLGFGIEVKFALLGGGEMLREYQEIAPVELLAGIDVDAFVAKQCQLGFRVSLTNTSASGGIVPKLKQQNFRVVSLIHELPSLIATYRLEESCRAIAIGSDALVFASQFVAEGFAKVVGPPATAWAVRPQGLYNPPPESTETRLQARARLGLPLHARIVLGVGYGDLRKGVDVFVRFSDQMRTVDPDCFFVWVGALDPAVQAWIASDLLRSGAKNVRFEGSREVVAGYYSAADITFLSSREDPFPTVVLESLSCGTPVIGFEGCGGFTDLLRDARLGRVIPFGSFGAFETAYKELLRMAADASHLEHRKDLIKDEFQWADYCFDLATLCFPGLERVSVVVPNFNYEAHLPSRLQSIVNQDYPIFEIIVLDDASTDNSIPVLLHFFERSHRNVALLQNTANSGSVFKQWKRGAELARGDYVWIAEADDLSSSAFISTMIGALNRCSNGIFGFCDSEAIGPEGETIYPSYKGYYAERGDHGLDTDGIWEAGEFRQRFLGVRNLILNASSVLWKRETLVSTFGKISKDLARYTCAGDWRIYLEACRLDGVITYIAEPLNKHRRHSGSVTSKLSKEGHLDEIRAIHSLILGELGHNDLKSDILSYMAELEAGWAHEHSV